MPTDINDLGWVVGNFQGYPADYPFLLVDGTLYNLYDLISSPHSIHDLVPVAINNKGQIIANSASLGGLLLIPIED